MREAGSFDTRHQRTQLLVCSVGHDHRCNRDTVGDVSKNHAGDESSQREGDHVVGFLLVLELMKGSKDLLPLLDWACECRSAVTFRQQNGEG